MKRILWAALGVLLLLSTGPAHAQYSSPYGRFSGSVYTRPPTLSPYLNLLRGGSPSANYFLGVVPQREQRTLNQILGSAINDLERRPAPGAETAEELIPTLPGTGHAVGYGVYAPYYHFSQQRPGVVGQSPASRRR